MKPVVIVGAGPSGACLALMLARRGLPVVLLDSAANLARQFRGEGLMPHGLEALNAMGLGDLRTRVPQRPLAGWGFCLDGRPLFRVAEPLEGPGHAPCRLVSQPALLAAVVEQLRALPQARVLLGQRVRGLIREGSRIGGVQLARGEAIEASLVVACDGRHSSLRQQSGLGLRTRTSPIDVLWFQLPAPAQGGQVHDPLAGDFLTVIGHEGIFSAFWSATGGLQLGWVLDAGSPEPPLDPGAWLERMASQSPPALAAVLRQQPGGLAEPVRLRVEVGLAPRWWCPGLLLLGDAAHPMSPVRAQGLNLALRDACVAGELLGDGLDPEGTDPRDIDHILPRIEARRRPETQVLQGLQARETQKGLLLRRLSVLWPVLSAGPSWLGPVLAHHWSHSQRPLRQGLSSLTAQPQ